MLMAEARWLGTRIERLGDPLFPMLNLGSSTRKLRTEVQPWIHREMFGPAERAGRSVVHADMQAQDGVDVVGDVTDPEFVAQLQQRGFRSVLCCNLLEHVRSPERIAAAIAEIVPVGGYLIITVPYRFPYHADPIDTMFRPTPSDIAALIPDTHVVESAVIECGTLLGYALGRFRENPTRFLRDVLSSRQEQTAVPKRDPRATLKLLPWFVRETAVSAVILRKGA